MMKMIIPFSVMILLDLSLKSLIIMASLTFSIFFMTSPNPWNSSFFSPLMFSDLTSFTMMFLSLSTFTLISLSSFNLLSISILISLINLILLLTFLSTKTIMFFIFFEAVLIPTTILISKKGSSPERLQAGIYLLMYTLFGSLPFLLGILWYSSTPDIKTLLLLSFPFSFHPIFLLAFLIKLPMFFFHLWLPKAHVEAPLEGSMILAAILLKLGGYGIIRFSPSIQHIPSSSKNTLITISLMGATMTSLNCIRQKDIKALIAYSSVAHMGLVLAASSSFKWIGVQSAILMMLAHGLSSSALFFIITVIYSNNHSRNMLSFKGLLLILPNLTFWWFVLMALNMSAPPSINMLSEIIMFSSIIHMDLLNILTIFLASFSTASFSIFLYANISHNSPFSNIYLTTNQKPFLSFFLHSFPLMLLTFKPDTFIYPKSLTTLVCGTSFHKIKLISIPFFIAAISSLFTSLYLILSNTMINCTFPIFPFSSSLLSIELIIDWAALMFISTISLISASIIIFSTTYIPKSELPRFITILLTFVMSMILLISSNNIFFIILGWDGLGFSSYILVIFYQNFQSSESGALTILSNRIGDIALILSIATLSSSMMWNLFLSPNFSSLTLLLLILAAFTKSAQTPFMAWLPAAMAAPTPISALVHSSTLVTAGVYLALRLMCCPHPSTLLYILFISSLTMLLSGLAANWEQDMKKIIAMSTLSQIAFMMFAISMNSPLAAFFHMITHALFKSTMFMCAGAIIHNTSYQDMRAHGNNSPTSPLISCSLSITNLALMGLPFMSGFFSKDMILENLLSSKTNFTLISSSLISIGLTASYSARMISWSYFPSSKANKDTLAMLDFNMALCLIIMTPYSIIMGSCLSWLIIMPNSFFISWTNKLLILTFMLMGMMMGLSLSFKSKIYKKLGSTAISLWSSHQLTCSPLSLLRCSNTASKMDKTWMELLSAQGVFLLTKNMSHYPRLSENFHLAPICLLISIPLMSLMS